MEYSLRFVCVCGLRFIVYRLQCTVYVIHLFLCIKRCDQHLLQFERLMSSAAAAATAYFGGKGSERSSSANNGSITCMTQAEFMTVTLSLTPASASPNHNTGHELQVVAAASASPPSECVYESNGVGSSSSSSSSSRRFLVCTLWDQLVAAALDISGIRRSLIHGSSSSSSSSIPPDNWDSAVSAMISLQSQLLQQQQRQQHAQV